MYGEKKKVLDDGFIYLVDTMPRISGNDPEFSEADAAVCQAARVSYGAGTQKKSTDKNLIRYLMRHLHTTPFEMVEMKFHLRIPMDAWRQYIRHRTANVNEYSTRYSVAIDARQKTLPNEWRAQSTDNKQGSSGTLGFDLGKHMSDREAALHDLSKRVYDERLEAGVAREQARKDLPLSTYTEAYWKMDLHNLFHFLKLRLHPHAQQEIRAYAEAIFEIVKWVAPASAEAFSDYTLHGTRLSAAELAVLRPLVSEDLHGRQQIEGLSSRELSELQAKFLLPG